LHFAFCFCPKSWNSVFLFSLAPNVLLTSISFLYYCLRRRKRQINCGAGSRLRHLHFSSVTMFDGLACLGRKITSAGMQMQQNRALRKSQKVWCSGNNETPPVTSIHYTLLLFASGSLPR
jgi:hypothetical protein